MARTATSPWRPAVYSVPVFKGFYRLPDVEGFKFNGQDRFPRVETFIVNEFLGHFQTLDSWLKELDIQTAGALDIKVERQVHSDMFYSGIIVPFTNEDDRLLFLLKWGTHGQRTTATII